jgi:hypothetical protein
MELMKNNIPLCIKCINCKIKKNTVSCAHGYFKNKTVPFIIVLTAFDFNCSKYENGDLDYHKMVE